MEALPSTAASRRSWKRTAAGAAVIGLLLLPASRARANVYATNVKLHDASNAPPSLATIPGSAANLARGHFLAIDYVLNEDATAGVTVEILGATNIVRTLAIPGGDNGARRGTNSVIWDGTDDATNAVSGTFNVRITAAALGFVDWTQISDDLNPGNYSYTPMGIAVNRNTNSPYYGRVFVGNAYPGIDPVNNTGDMVGMQKLNADATAAEEGIFSTGGWPWAGDVFSPWKVEVADDDSVYINDWTSSGLVLRFDQALSTNSQTLVLRSDNWPPIGASTANLSGPFVTVTGTNTQVWMADISYPGSVGVRRWTVSTNATLATNDLGTTIIQAGGGSDLTLYPYDVAVDAAGRIYTVQFRLNSGDAANRVFRFPAYDESGTPEMISDWKIGSADDTMRGAAGIAVDPAGAFVAVAFMGNQPSWSGTINRVGGGFQIFSATDGAPVYAYSPAAYHDHTDVAWDNAGNLYVCDDWDSLWRVFSPPGTNAATTVALQSVLSRNTPEAPLLSAPTLAGGEFQFTLTGQPFTGYVIQLSTDLHHWTPVATNPVSDNPMRLIAVPATGSPGFYRAQVMQ